MTYDIESFLAPENVLVGVQAGCKRSVLKQMAAHAAKTLGIDDKGLLDALLEREQLGSTGIGRGVAVPHGRTDLRELRGILARLDTPVDFEAVDDHPVDLVFMLLAPHQADGEHLKALSRVARLLRSEQVQRAMRGASTAEALHAIAIGGPDAEAA